MNILSLYNVDLHDLLNASRDHYMYFADEYYSQLSSNQSVVATIKYYDENDNLQSCDFQVIDLFPCSENSMIVVFNADGSIDYDYALKLEIAGGKIINITYLE